MFDKERKKIEETIQKWITEYVLNDNFKTRRGKKIGRVENVECKNLKFNEEESDFRNEIFLHNVRMNLRVWEIQETSEKKQDLDLGANKPLVLKYNEKKEAYEILNDNEINIIDYTLW